ncbi:MAG: hypothetical protein P0Y49_08995 [Candidatus Pedobacter colombiensis]|uniref:Uncharacterized protein n=1 Tax=Candidatus Pedobacter colombiensis TaxID=3121371 RepID=A0AAJ5W9K1_9SPHI|nr:hypothetical protein [Pedobacter sp.]WEK21278.1 MAG: hypothetical protein P0Y49_08995 [Pedobacter sp.]
MTSNQGDVIERIVRTKIGISELSRILHVSRTSIYNWFQHGHLNHETICKIGQAINHDFANEFPEEFANAKQQATMDVGHEKTDQNANCSIQYWMNKYITLLEKYTELLSEYAKPEAKSNFRSITARGSIRYNHDKEYRIDKRDHSLSCI